MSAITGASAMPRVPGLRGRVEQPLERRDRPGLDQLRELRVAEHRGIAGQHAEERLLVVGDDEDGAALLELAEVPGVVGVDLRQRQPPGRERQGGHAPMVSAALHEIEGHGFLRNTRRATRSAATYTSRFGSSCAAPTASMTIRRSSVARASIGT